MSRGNILVVGGAGYIGSHACLALAEAGYTPVTLDSLVYGRKDFVQWGPFHHGDLGDEGLIAALFEEYHIQAVFHFAAFTYVGESVTDPLKYYDNNVAAPLALFRAMRDHNVKRFIFSSTCATYGVPASLPIQEDFPQNPVNPYGRTKLMVEQILQDLVLAHGFQATSFRYFNASGADLEARIGEDHKPETHLIPLAIEAAYGGKPLTIFGKDYPTTDGTCIRDYIHVNDLAQAHVLGLERMLSETSKSEFESYNLGTGQGFSILQIINEVERVTGRKVPCSFGARRAGDPPELIATGQKARVTLGWNPQASDLATIISSADRWYKKMNSL